MRLLFDENLAARLAITLGDIYPDSTHVLALGLGGASDQAIWERAAAEDFVLVTKDEDFHSFAVLYGPPPKVIWIRLGNCTTQDVGQLLRVHRDDVHSFWQRDELAVLALG